MSTQIIRKVKLPEFSDSPQGALAKFIFDYEPEGIEESSKFRRHLCGILNNCRNEPDIEWVANNTNNKPSSP